MARGWRHFGIVTAGRRSSAHHADISGKHLRDLFADDPERGERLPPKAPASILDYSKNRVTDETLQLLVELAEESGLGERSDAMFSGEKINITEDRAVLHVALRVPRDARSSSTATTSSRRCTRCSTGWAPSPSGSARGEWKGHTGKPIRNVVNIGIGGSDLGPVMAYEALRHYTRRET